MKIGHSLAAVRPLGRQFTKLFLAAGVAATLVAGLGGSAQAVQAVPAARATQAPKAAAPPTIFVQSCTGNSFCLATGDKPGHGYSPFIEEWNGKTWRIIPNPSGFSGYMTCGTPTFCLAAGPRVDVRLPRVQVSKVLNDQVNGIG